MNLVRLILATMLGLVVSDRASAEWVDPVGHSRNVGKRLGEESKSCRDGQAHYASVLKELGEIPDPAEFFFGILEEPSLSQEPSTAQRDFMIALEGLSSRIDFYDRGRLSSMIALADFAELPHRVDPEKMAPLLEDGITRSLAVLEKWRFDQGFPLTVWYPLRNILYGDPAIKLREEARYKLLDAKADAYGRIRRCAEALFEEEMFLRLVVRRWQQDPRLGVSTKELLAKHLPNYPHARRIIEKDSQAKDSHALLEAISTERQEAMLRSESISEEEMTDREKRGLLGKEK